MSAAEASTQAPAGTDHGDDPVWTRKLIVGQRVVTWFCLLAGATALAASFPPLAWAPMALPALVLLIVGAGLARSWWHLVFAGLVSGVVFYALLLKWLDQVGVDAWLILSAYCALWWMVTLVATRAVMRLPGWPLWVACVWVLSEALRGAVPWGGFPWGSTGFTQSPGPAMNLAWIGGVPLLTFAVVVAAALVVWAAVASGLAPRLPALVRDCGDGRNVREPAWAAVVAVIAALAIFWGPSWFLAAATDRDEGPSPRTASVALVQGSVPDLGFGASNQRLAVLRNHVEATEQLAADVQAGRVSAPTVVIWPENSTDVDPLRFPDAAELITRAANTIGVPILVGAVTVAPTPADPISLWNVGVLWYPEIGPGAMYIKQHPLPFGEYVPFRSVLTQLIGRYDRVPYDFAPGPGPEILSVDDVRIGDIICFEVAYGGLVRETVRAGAAMLAVQTNNATFTSTGPGGLAQPEQQQAMARIRAVEFGRDVVTVATSGLTGHIRSDGSLVAEVPPFESGFIVTNVALRDELTPAARFGGWIQKGLCILAVMALCWAAWLARGSNSNPNER